MSAIWVLDESTAKPDRLFVFAYWAENQLIERLGRRILGGTCWIVFTSRKKLSAGFLLQHALHWVGEPASGSALRNPASRHAEGRTDRAWRAKKLQGLVIGHQGFSISLPRV
ncbi:hypothetical protein ACSHWC_29055 [Pseudomonas fluorescens]